MTTTEENTMKWYTIQTRSLYENKIMQAIPAQAKEAGIEADVGMFFSPEKPVVTYKDGVRKESKIKMYPNYIFIQLNYSEKIWHALKKINGFAGFIGGDKSKPQSIPHFEIEAIMQQIQEAPARPKVEYALGAKVLVKDGAFKDFYGTVENVDYEKGRITVNVTIFGRETPMDMEINDIELSPK